MSWTIKAVNRTHSDFISGENKEWKEPFIFVQGADSQLGMFADFQVITTEPKWAQEIALTELAVKKVNEMQPRPKFFVICGDLCHEFYDSNPEVRAAQDADFKKVLCKLNPNIPVVCVCGNHDVGDNPTVNSINKFKSNYGDDYFSFHAGGVFFICINSQLFYQGDQVPDQVTAQEQWIDAQLEIARNSTEENPTVAFAHCISRDCDDKKNMSKGVAVVFKKRFGKPQPSHRLSESLACQKQGNGATVYSLITKSKFFEKPSIENYNKAFAKLEEDFSKRGLKTLICSPLGCVRDQIPLQHFAQQIATFQQSTRATINIIIFEEKTKKPIRKGLSHKQFVDELKLALAPPSSEPAEDPTTGGVLAGESDLLQPSVLARALPHSTYAEAVKALPDTLPDVEKQPLEYNVSKLNHSLGSQKNLLRQQRIK